MADRPAAAVRELLSVINVVVRPLPLVRPFTDRVEADVIPPAPTDSGPVTVRVAA